MIKAIIFDLDNCLSAADEPGRQLLEPMFAAIREANKGHVRSDQLAAAFEACWRHPLDWVAHTYGFSNEMLAAGWAAGKQIEVQQPMHGYPDLAELARLDAKLFLVSSGFRRLQESKVRALGIASRFAAVYIDAIDDPNRLGKRAIFSEILTTYHLAPEEVLVVGDNPDSEIKAGNSLEIPTVQILREGVPHSENARYHITDLCELRRLL